MSDKRRRLKIEAPAQSSLKANEDDAVLVLRLGMVITALRAAHRLTTCVADRDEPADMRDRLWAFLLAAAYLHELRVTLQPRFPRVRDLAKQTGATDEEIKAVGDVMSGKSQLGKSLNRIRNQLVFHFDEDSVKKWVQDFKQDTVVWVEASGTTAGEALYRASTDAAASAILPDVDGSTAEGREAFKAFINDILNFTQIATRFFDHAITGYLQSVGAEMKEE